METEVEHRRRLSRERNARYRERQRSRGVKKSPPTAEQRERKNAAQREARKLYGKEYNLRAVYKMTLADYERMLEAQGGGCAVCARPPAPGKYLDVDHDHTCCPWTGQATCGECVRGCCAGSATPRCTSWTTPRSALGRWRTWGWENSFRRRSRCPK